VAIFLGIDGGATKTTCLVGDETSVLATATTGSCSVIRVGEEKAREALHDAVRKACSLASIDPRQIAGACVGATGTARPQIAEKVTRLMAEVVSCPVQVVGDMVVALQAAFGSGPGVIAIAGSGSIAFGRGESGETLRAGGWGFQISDEGSGYWVGRTALSRALRASDEGAQPVLLTEVMKIWKLSSPEELIQVANASPPPDFAGLFPVVLAAADAGDVLARTILTIAGSELAGVAKIVAGRLFSKGTAVPVAMAGSVFRQCALVRQVFYNGVRSEFPQAAMNPTVIEPVRGALELARRVARSSG
jgi:N-acetylglucosamine kinase-like BadF-type ATPase